MGWLPSEEHQRRQPDKLSLPGARFSPGTPCAAGPSRNQQIIGMTDGEPTAQVAGQDIMLIYPPSERTARATLEEVQRWAGEGSIFLKAPFSRM